MKSADSGNKKPPPHFILYLNFAADARERAVFSDNAQKIAVLYLHNNVCVIKLHMYNIF